MVFQQKLLGKAYFNFKMTGPAIVRPANSVLWKVSYDCTHPNTVSKLPLQPVPTS